MASEKKKRKWNRIPIRFLDAEQDEHSGRSEAQDLQSMEDNHDQIGDPDEDLGIDDDDVHVIDEEETDADDYLSVPSSFENSLSGSRPATTGELGGPAVAELVATRAELKRVETEVAELKDRLARRQADFENSRKRTERERSETYNRVVADVAAKLLPVLDNLKRALEAEASVENTESDEFRHFLSGVDLIYKPSPAAPSAHRTQPSCNQPQICMPAASYTLPPRSSPARAPSHAATSPPAARASLHIPASNFPPASPGK
jgi:molecular chaperone GrpE